MAVIFYCAMRLFLLGGNLTIRINNHIIKKEAPCAETQGDERPEKNINNISSIATFQL